MKSITERIEIGSSLMARGNRSYDIGLNDLQALSKYNDKGRAFIDAYLAGFYAGVSAAIGRGYSKKNDPRKAAVAEEGLK